MHAVEKTKTDPPHISEIKETPKAPLPEPTVKKDESADIIRQIRNITAFVDCV
jgi:hypothetical protein